MVEVDADEADLRLDRWFARHYPTLAHGQLQKLLRTGQVRLDGGRARANARVSPGQIIRVPPTVDAAHNDQPNSGVERQDTAEFDWIRDRVLYCDDRMLAIDKPHGLAVQGGTKQRTHIDGLAAALTLDAAVPPRLVHRLDKDTSGVLVLGRTAGAAAWLTRQFREGTVRKRYWAVTAGAPTPPTGEVNLPISKARTADGERMVVDEAAGRPALTVYQCQGIHTDGTAWLILEPRTGRTHQLRVHCAALGCPILGDRKYGAASPSKAERRLHLHAQGLTIEPAPGRPPVTLTAPLPEHMAQRFTEAGWHGV